eukprot:g2559.t1
MPTDLLELPGYPGHDQAQPFAQECVRDITEDTLADAAALQTELSRRVAQLSENQVASLTALSPQTRKLRLRVFLNRVSAHVYNEWTADERTEQLQWRGSSATTPQGQRLRWSSWYDFEFDDAGAAIERAEERAPAAEEQAPAADEEQAPAPGEQAPAADEEDDDEQHEDLIDVDLPVPATELLELCQRAGLRADAAGRFTGAGLSVAALGCARSMSDLAMFCPPAGTLDVASVAKAFTAVREATKDAKAKAESGSDAASSLRPLELGKYGNRAMRDLVEHLDGVVSADALAWAADTIALCRTYACDNNAVYALLVSTIPALHE